MRERLAGREPLIMLADRAVEEQREGVDRAHRRLGRRLGELVEAHAMLVAQRGQADVQPLERLAVRGAGEHVGGDGREQLVDRLEPFAQWIGVWFGVFLRPFRSYS